MTASLRCFHVENNIEEQKLALFAGFMPLRTFPVLCSIMCMCGEPKQICIHAHLITATGVKQQNMDNPQK